MFLLCFGGLASGAMVFLFLAICIYFNVFLGYVSLWLYFWSCEGKGLGYKSSRTTEIYTHL
jgi:hypothetical protein